MKTKKLLAGLLVLSLLSASVQDVPAQARSAVKLNKKSITLKVGQTAKLKVTGTLKSVRWSSNSKNVATISRTRNGAAWIKGKSAGGCTITVKARYYVTKKSKKTKKIKKVLKLYTGRCTVFVKKKSSNVSQATAKPQSTLPPAPAATAKPAVVSSTPLQSATPAPSSGTSVVKTAAPGTTSAPATTKKPDTPAETKKPDTPYVPVPGIDYPIPVPDATKTPEEKTATAAPADYIPTEAPAKPEETEAPGTISFPEEPVATEPPAEATSKPEETEAPGTISFPEEPVTTEPPAEDSPSEPDIPVVSDVFAGGNGTESSPYLVENLTQLKEISKYPNAHYKQNADIALGYTSFEPLFSEEVPFTGVYDGDSHTISQYNYSDSSAEKRSMFGIIADSATLKNLTVKDSFMTLKSGSLLTLVNHGTITNCTVEDSNISTSTGFHAGLICSTNDGLISGCKAAGNISSSYQHTNYYGFGGIAGRNDGNIFNSETSGKISINNSRAYGYRTSAGGVSGENTGMVKNSTSTMEINVSTWGSYSAYAGGIIGCNDGGQVIGCTYGGTEEDITASSSNKGTIVGGGTGIVS